VGEGSPLGLPEDGAGPGPHRRLLQTGPAAPSFFINTWTSPAATPIVGDVNITNINVAGLK
jgi:hypothetical protein